MRMTTSCRLVLIAIALVSLCIAEPFTFEENRGQRDSRIRYTARSGDTSIIVDNESFTVAIGSGTKQESVRIRLGRPAKAEGDQKLASISRYRLTGSSNYMVSAPHFGAVRFNAVADKADALLIAAHESLPYRFVIQPGGDPASAQMKFTGVSKLSLDEDGNLHILLASYEIVQAAPRVFQTISDDSVPLPAKYLINGDTVSVQVKHYEKTRELIIQPKLLLTGDYPVGKRIARALR